MPRRACSGARERKSEVTAGQVSPRSHEEYVEVERRVFSDLALGHSELEYGSDVSDCHLGRIRRRREEYCGDEVTLANEEKRTGAECLDSDMLWTN